MHKRLRACLNNSHAPETPNNQDNEQRLLIAAARDALRAKHWPELNRLTQGLLQRWPRHSEGHFLAGVLAGNAERYSLAAKAFERVLQLDDSRCDAAIHLARCLVRTGEHRRAAQLVRIATSDLQGNAFLLDLAGSVLTHVGCHREALPFFQQAVALEDNRVEYLNNLSSSALFNGDMEMARTCLEAALAIAPDDARAWWQLARLKHADPRDIARQLDAKLDTWRTPAALAYAHYGLGKLWEDACEWGKAGDHYQWAAREARKVVPRYQPSAEAALIEAVIEHYDKQWLAADYGAGVVPRACEPLFIVGLPRTGTTLCDTILTSHPEVSGAGELPFLGLGVKNLSGVTGPEMVSAAVMSRAAALAPEALSAFYWRESAYLGQTGRYRTDKLPLNMYYLGHIAKAFPNAKIVHMKRDPMDACFAIYKQLFAGAYPFSYDVQDLVHFYLGYHRLMAHWREVLGERLVEVTYEALVSQPAQVIPALLQRLGLPEAEACLHFYRQKHTVATASAAQVREKPHARSVGRWRHFEQLMAPVRQALLNAGIV